MTLNSQDRARVRPVERPPRGRCLG